MWAVAGASSALLGLLHLRRHEDGGDQQYLPIVGKRCSPWLLAAAAVDFIFGVLIAITTEAAVELPSEDVVGPGFRIVYAVLLGGSVPAAFRAPVLKKFGKARWALLYTPIRENITECYWSAALTDRQELVDADTKEAMRLSIKPQRMANDMKDWINDHPRHRRRKQERYEEIDGAMQRTTREDKLRRLLSLTYKYSMPGFRKRVVPMPSGKRRRR